MTRCIIFSVHEVLHVHAVRAVGNNTLRLPILRVLTYRLLSVAVLRAVMIPGGAAL